MDIINSLEEFKSLSEVDDVNKINSSTKETTNKNEQNQNLVENNINLVIDKNVCNKCKRNIEKSNLKRVFGQKNVYECKGVESKKCDSIVDVEKKEIIRKKQQEEKEKKQKLFNDEYLEYVLENQHNFIVIKI